MFIACPACDTNYKLDDLALGPDGRRVRCTTCGNVWRAMPPPPEDSVLPNQNIDPFTTTEPLAEQDMSLSFTADKPFTQDYDPSFDLPPEDAAPAIERPPIPEGLVSTAAVQDAPPPVPGENVAAYMPAGMSANLLGACVFLLPFLVTLALMIALRAPLVRHLPALTPVYQAMGLEVAVPGGGLRLSTLVAERRIDGEKKTLSMSAQLANISPTAQAYPALKATAYGASGAVIQAWSLPSPKGGKALASGEEAPIRAEFKDIPDTATKLELRVTQP